MTREGSPLPRNQSTEGPRSVYYHSHLKQRKIDNHGQDAGDVPLAQIFIDELSVREPQKTAESTELARIPLSSPRALTVTLPHSVEVVVNMQRRARSRSLSMGEDSMEEEDGADAQEQREDFEPGMETVVEREIRDHAPQHHSEEDIVMVEEKSGPIEAESHLQEADPANQQPRSADMFWEPLELEVRVSDTSNEQHLPAQSPMEPSNLDYQEANLPDQQHWPADSPMEPPNLDSHEAASSDQQLRATQLSAAQGPPGDAMLAETSAGPSAELGPTQFRHSRRAAAAAAARSIHLAYVDPWKLRQQNPELESDVAGFARETFAKHKRRHEEYADGNDAHDGEQAKSVRAAHAERLAQKLDADFPLDEDEGDDNVGAGGRSAAQALRPRQRMPVGGERARARKGRRPPPQRVFMSSDSDSSSSSDSSPSDADAVVFMGTSRESEPEAARTPRRPRQDNGEAMEVRPRLPRGERRRQGGTRVKRKGAVGRTRRSERQRAPARRRRVVDPRPQLWLEENRSEPDADAEVPQRRRQPDFMRAARRSYRRSVASATTGTGSLISRLPVISLSSDSSDDGAEAAISRVARRVYSNLDCRPAWIVKPTRPARQDGLAISRVFTVAECVSRRPRERPLQPVRGQGRPRRKALAPKRVERTRTTAQRGRRGWRKQQRPHRTGGTIAPNYRLDLQDPPAWPLEQKFRRISPVAQGRVYSLTGDPAALLDGFRYAECCFGDFAMLSQTCARALQLSHGRAQLTVLCEDLIALFHAAMRCVVTASLAHDAETDIRHRRQLAAEFARMHELLAWGFAGPECPATEMTLFWVVSYFELEFAFLWATRQTGVSRLYRQLAQRDGDGEGDAEREAAKLLEAISLPTVVASLADRFVECSWERDAREIDKLAQPGEQIGDWKISCLFLLLKALDAAQAAAAASPMDADLWTSVPTSLWAALAPRGPLPWNLVALTASLQLLDAYGAVAQSSCRDQRIDWKVVCASLLGSETPAAISAEMYTRALGNVRALGAVYRVDVSVCGALFTFWAQTKLGGLPPALLDVFLDQIMRPALREGALPSGPPNPARKRVLSQLVAAVPQGLVFDPQNMLSGNGYSVEAVQSACSIVDFLLRQAGSDQQRTTYLKKYGNLLRAEGEANVQAETAVLHAGLRGLLIPGVLRIEPATVVYDHLGATMRLFARLVQVYARECNEHFITSRVSPQYALLDSLIQESLAALQALWQSLYDRPGNGRDWLAHRSLEQCFGLETLYLLEPRSQSSAEVKVALLRFLASALDIRRQQRPRLPAPPPPAAFKRRRAPPTEDEENEFDAIYGCLDTELAAIPLSAAMQQQQQQSSTHRAALVKFERADRALTAPLRKLTTWLSALVQAHFRDPLPPETFASAARLQVDVAAALAQLGQLQWNALLSDVVFADWAKSKDIHDRPDNRARLLLSLERVAALTDAGDVPAETSFGHKFEIIEGLVQAARGNETIRGSALHAILQESVRTVTRFVIRTLFGGSSSETGESADLAELLRRETEHLDLTVDERSRIDRVL